MYKDSLDSASFIKSLWRPDSLFNIKVPIVDTLVQDSSRPTNIMWLFTDTKGNVRKKKDSNCTVPKIIERFLGEKLNGNDLSYLDLHKIYSSNSYAAYFISHKNFKLIDRSKFLKTISRSLGECEAVSQIKSSNPESCYILYLSNKESSTIYRSYRESPSKERSLISASTIINRLKQISDTIIKAVEENNNARIEESELIFVEDTEKSLYFIGTYFCKLKPVVKFLNASTDRKHLETSRLRSDSQLLPLRRLMNRTASSAAKFRVNSTSEVDSINLCFKHSVKKDCAGDFCKFVISSSIDRNKEEIDYDNLLDMVRNAFKHKEGFLKLHLANEFILKKRDKLRYTVVQHEIPCSLIALGKIFIQRSDFDLEDDSHTIDLCQLLHSFVGNNECILETDRIRLKTSAMRIPFHYYKNVKVCDRCYRIYSILRQSQHESNRLSRADSELRSQSITMTRKSCHESSTRFLNKRNGIGESKQLRSSARKYTQTALGYINKNSINDLLIDMNHAVVDTELTEETGNRKQFLKICKAQTEEFKCKQLEQEFKQKEEIKPNLTPVESQPSKLIPIPITKLSSRCRFRGSWKKFIEMTRIRRS